MLKHNFSRLSGLDVTRIVVTLELNLNRSIKTIGNKIKKVWERRSPSFQLNYTTPACLLNLRPTCPVSEERCYDERQK